MKADEIRDMILEVIHEIVPDEDLSNLDPDVRIRDQIEMDSMDFLDIVMELRKRYSITVPEDDYMKLSTLNSSVAYLECHSALPLSKGQGSREFLLLQDGGETFQWSTVTSREVAGGGPGQNQRAPGGASLQPSPVSHSRPMNGGKEKSGELEAVDSHAPKWDSTTWFS
jgi:acyl carrier protein